ncbi:MAG: fatty acid oxidation complex subunit alpha FadB [Deltaproteobacteria bacterium]|nr:fatty acid oxidation complex subunit alpha FadB [Deltaproteobacteria bacterium]
MKFQGKCFQLSKGSDGVARLVFDLQGESMNTLGSQPMAELAQALDLLEKEKGLKGMILSTGKKDFAAGANVKEFLGVFQGGEQAIVDKNLKVVHGLYNRIEDLPFPTVAALQGIVYGGGMELCMSTTFRVAAEGTRFGQPEIKLGLIPGWGGCVRLPRLIGADHAIEIIATGRDMLAEEAHKKRLVQAVVKADKLEAAALALILNGEQGSWQAMVEKKKSPLKLNGIERLMVFGLAKMMVADQAGPHYPAPLKAVEVMEAGADKSRDAAQEPEIKTFAQLAITPTAANLVRIFLGDLFLKKRAKEYAAQAQPVKQAAVLGAGIMGGGVAYQSAYKGVPILMKDIAPKAIEHGYEEISRLLGGQVKRGKLSAEEASTILTRVQATMSYGDFQRVDLAVEAVVENPKVKKQVLADVEGAMGDAAVIATNTSTISVDFLAQALKKPERFLGMHFFNPVHRMPLVEVIRGKATSPQALATVVAYAQTMGKTPVVVNDGPGFLVNRILFPYLFAFQALVAQGADIPTVDKTMEGWGWPMGPAYLSDVVGLDTAAHVADVLAETRPDMIQKRTQSPVDALVKAGYFGQKNDKGFYQYTKDKKGKPQKKYDPAVMTILKPVITGGAENISADDIVERMMLPMIIEASRCLEDRIVETPVELDMSLVYGLGFPPFRGGLLAWADSLGLEHLVKAAEKYKDLGKGYEPTKQMKQLAEQKKTFHPPLG